MIPKTFHLMGQKIKVTYDNKKCSSENALGLSDLQGNEILIAREVDSKKVPIDRVEQTFVHELVHFILHNMNEKKLCYDEKFVDNFAGLLHQYLKTKK